MNRIQRIFSNLTQEVDTFVIANSQYPNLDLNFFYVTELIDSGVFENSYAIAYEDGKVIVVTSKLEEPIAKKGKWKVLVYSTKDERDKILKDLLKIERLGFNSAISHKQLEELSRLTKAKIFDISEAVAKSRSIKDKKEIELIKKACKVSSKAAEEIKNFIKEKVTEKELSNKLIELQYHYGATNLAFSPPIASFGKNSSEPHHFPSDYKLKKNEFVLTDFGAEFRRYASDITRTFVFGKANEKMKEIYETVLDAQLQATDMIKDGINGKDVDKLARDIINKKFKGRFLHSLGHEVGLSIHDGNRLSSQVDFILKENMVVTVEPGIYIPSIGGVRIEDTILVRKNKAKILTKSSKELVEL